MLIRKNFLIVITTAIIILFCGGIYLYYYFFRQVNAKLIETIPTDAAFIYQINDNETFVKSVRKISTHINPLFGLDAYPGCQFFIDQLPGKYNQVVFSGHQYDDKFSILFACKIDVRAFTPLLANLQIDPKNCTTFEQCKIYTYGTHLKRFVFTYHKGIFLASENIILLKKAIAQLRNPKNLTNLKSFETLFIITEKNKKQNWLILNNSRYFSHFESFYNDELNNTLTRFSEHTPWAAFQVRFSGMEMLFSGYLAVNHSFEEYINQMEEKYLYYSSLSKNNPKFNIEKDVELQYAKSKFPSHNDFELAIHAASPDYWGEHLSEIGMKKFPIAKMRLFAFSWRIGQEDNDGRALPLQWVTANGVMVF